jgi:hypothetical protein
VTWPAILCALLVVGAALLAVDRAVMHRRHWPIAALACVWMLDPLRPNAGRWACVWALALPALSAGAAVMVLARAPRSALAALGLVLMAGGAELRRSGDPASALLLASALSLVAQALAALFAASRRLDLSDRCALALLAGDVAALAGPLADRASLDLQIDRWWLAQVQGAIVAGVLCALHIMAPMEQRRG